MQSPDSTATTDAQVTVAVGQFSPGADSAANLTVMRRLLESAHGNRVDVMVFPEYSSFFDVPLDERLLAAAEDIDGPFTRGLAELARDSGAHVVAGMVEHASVPGKVHNTLVAVSPAGEVVASYRKVHLYDAFGARESDWMEHGPIADPAVFDVNGFRFGLQTCYDLRFPEVSRRLIDAGTDVLVVPAEWVAGPNKELHWRTLLTARAIENTAFAVAADHRPPIGIGCSMIVDAMGLTMVQLADEEGVGVATLKRSLIDTVRTNNPALSLRRFRVEPVDD